MRPEVDSVQAQGKACIDKYGDKDAKMKELKVILANVNVNWEFIEDWCVQLNIINNIVF